MCIARMGEMVMLILISVLLVIIIIIQLLYVVQRLGAINPIESFPALDSY